MDLRKFTPRDIALGVISVIFIVLGVYLIQNGNPLGWVFIAVDLVGSAAVFALRSRAEKRRDSE